MAKRNGWRKVFKGINNTMDKIEPEKPDNKKDIKKQSIGLTKDVLKFEEFQHDHRQKLCDWVNENNINTKSIVHDGNKYFVFYLDKELNGNF